MGACGPHTPQLISVGVGVLEDPIRCRKSEVEARYKRQARLRVAQTSRLAGFWKTSKGAFLTSIFTVFKVKFEIQTGLF